jgi:hypothetical protein
MNGFERHGITRLSPSSLNHFAAEPAHWVMARLLRFRALGNYPLPVLRQVFASAGLVVFEEVRRHLGTTAGHIYGGYLAHLTAWAEANRIPYHGVPVGTIKRHATGKGNADKAAVIEAVRKLGFNPADDNEADALALLHWALSQGIGEER